MKYIRLLFYILFISKTIVTWGGENIGGLSFRAYEYSKDEIGKNLKKWSEAIEKESISPTITPEDNSPKDIHENF